MGVESRIGTGSQRIALQLHRVRGADVILDSDLARLYAWPTKRLNQHVKRHFERFPEDFAFQLTDDEWRHIRHGLPQKRGRTLANLPTAFTEQGVLMLVGNHAWPARSRDFDRAPARICSDTQRGAQTNLGCKRRSVTDLKRLERLEREVLGAEPMTVAYFVQSGTDGPIKIGVTTDFGSRFRSLEMSSPIRLFILGVVPGDIESMCHASLAQWRLHGEWFTPSPEVLEFVREQIAKQASVN
jgi:hypothetical protein